MVAGDLVNTAARVQTQPSPARCSSARRHAAPPRPRSRSPTPASTSSRARAEPVHLWQALRVAAQRRGEGRSVGLEAPFVGRAAELRLVKDLFHAAADESRAPARVDRRRRRDRQVAALLGVREVHRRPGDGHLVAPRPLPLVRRGRRLLGAGRDGARPGEDPRGRGRGQRRREAARHARAPRPRRGRARLDRAAPAAPPRARRADGPRPRGPLLGLAALLRAAGRAGAARDGVRGHPLGGRGARRVHRPPPRLGPAPPDLRRHARAPRDRRPAPRLPRLDA